MRGHQEKNCGDEHQVADLNGGGIAADVGQQLVAGVVGARRTDEDPEEEQPRTRDEACARKEPTDSSPIAGPSRTP